MQVKNIRFYPTVGGISLQQHLQLCFITKNVNELAYTANLLSQVCDTLKERWLFTNYHPMAADMESEKQIKSVRLLA